MSRDVTTSPANPGTRELSLLLGDGYLLPPNNPLPVLLVAFTMNSSELILMTPYLHFNGGDHLYFKSWHPSSRAAIAGASIALLVLAILERLLHATRGVMDARWRRRYGLHDHSH